MRGSEQPAHALCWHAMQLCVTAAFQEVTLTCAAEGTRLHLEADAHGDTESEGCCPRLSWLLCSS